MNTLHLQIVTPERTLLDQVADSVTCTTTLGQITVLPGHAPLVAELVPGELVSRIQGDEKLMHVGGGFLQISPAGDVVVLADIAEHEHEIDANRAKEALERAKQAMQSSSLSSREYAATSALLERNYARLRVVRKRAHRRTSSITGEGVLEE